MNRTLHICGHCGLRAWCPLIVPTQDWVGGEGWRWVLICRDRVACWTRFDAVCGALGSKQRAPEVST